MKLLLPITASCLIAFPLSASSWSMMGRPTRILISPTGRRMMLDTTPVEDMMMMRHRRHALFNKAMETKAHVTTPHYEVVDNDTTVSISVDVPGVKPEDIDVTVDGEILSIQGRRRDKKLTEEGTASSTSQSFSQSFTLDPSVVDLDQFTAQLDNGVLVVTAPKDTQRTKKNTRHIPITTTHTSSKTVSKTHSNVENYVPPEETEESAPPQSSIESEGGDTENSDELKEEGGSK